MAIMLSLVISMLMGKRLIAYLQYKLIGETVRDLGLAGEAQKKGNQPAASTQNLPKVPPLPASGCGA